MQERERLSWTHLDFLSAFICIGEECLTHWTLLDDTDLTESWTRVRTDGKTFFLIK